MIIIPVTDDVGRKFVMLFITDDAIARLQAGQRCDLLVPRLDSLGLAGVVVRHCVDDVEAAAVAQRIAGDVELRFDIVIRDAVKPV